MSFYEQFRHFADSYWLVVMVIIYLGLCLWPFRPGGKRYMDDAANSIFEDERNG